MAGAEGKEIGGGSQPVVATKTEPSGAIKVFRRFVGGTIGGVVQAFCSHPFDTIKSRMQQGLSPSIGSCVKDMHSVEGLRGFYRGVTPPLFVMGTYNAVLFSVNQFMTLLVTPKDHPKGEPLAFWRVAIAAQLTAPATVLVLTPAEVIKVRLQVQPKGKDRLYKGPLDCAKKLIKAEGFGGLLRGYVPTLGTRVVGLPFYFLSYEFCKRALTPAPTPDQPAAAAPYWVPPVAGAFAGIWFWTACYPLDVTKTAVQAGNTTAKEFLSRTLNTGVSGLYKGYVACLLRAVPANASVWLAMEETIKVMDSVGW